MNHLTQLLEETTRRFPKKQAFLFKENGRYESITWADFSKKVDAAASLLLGAGVRPGDKVAILSENRLEWALVDFATLGIGAVSVPIYTSLTAAEIEYLLSDSEARMVAVSNIQLFEKISEIQIRIPSLKVVLGFEAALSARKNNLSIPLLFLSDAEKQALSPELGSIRSRIKPDDLASIIYTSGTTGVPKGVMLTHRNFIQNALLSKAALRMSDQDVHLSFLPLTHVFERLAGHYLMVHLGATIAYAENMDTVPRNILEVRPTFLLGVPRFYEKIKSRVLEKVAQGGFLKKALFLWAQGLGEQKRKAVASDQKQSALFRIRYAMACLLVYQKFRQGLGGRLRFCVSGGAPLPKEIAEFFYDLGVLILEGYGLTETAPVMNVNREDRFKFGSVGPALEDVEVKIAEDGEILTRSACVMAGYYKKPDETQAVLKNGCFHTGDLGSIDKNGFLSITGRKKELIVTSGGKKVSPRPIEEAIEQDAYILRCMLFGDGQRFITAFLVPCRERLEEFATQNKIAYSEYPSLLKNEKIHQLLEQRVDALTQHLANFEKIKYFALLENDFSQNAGELTPTLKVKRDVVIARYQYLLLPFYALDKT